MNDDEKLDKRDYTVYTLGELIKCDTDELRGDSSQYESYLKGRINGYQEAYHMLTGGYYEYVRKD